MEDNGGRNYSIKNIIGFVEYPQSEIKETLDGSYPDNDIIVMLGLDNCETENLLDSEFQPKIKPGQDRMKVNGKMYQITYSGVDGGFQKKNIMVILKGNISKNN